MADQPPTLTSAQQAQVQAFLQRHPGVSQNPIARNARLAHDPALLKDWVQLNQSLGLGGDYVIDPSSGSIHENASLGKFLLEGAAIVGGTLAGGAGLAALLGSGALAGGAAAGGSYIGSSVAGTAAAASGAGAGAGLGTAAAVAAPSLWDKVVKVGTSIAQPVSSVVGAKIAADGNSQAAEIAAKSAQEALDWEKQQYGIRQAQLAPTINVGNASRVKLADLLGLKVPAGGWAAPTVPQPGLAPNAVETPTFSPQGETAPPGMVKMIDPTGKPGFVPQRNVQAAITAGGRLA